MKFLIGFVFFSSLSAVAFNSLAQTTLGRRYSLVDSLLGKWVSYSTEFEEKKQVSKTKTIEKASQILCNVCPEIEFKSDSTATIKLEGLNEVSQTNFLWSIRGNNLVIRQLSKEKSNNTASLVFPDGQYNVDTRISKAIDRHREVVLTGANGTRYILTRSSE